MSKFLGLATLIKSVYKEYHTITDLKAKSIIETTVGAGIFYLPKSKDLLWSGLISIDAIKNNERCEDHMYPRKVSAVELLSVNWDGINDPEEYLKQLYFQKYGKYNYVTKSENRRLVEFQKKGVFTTPEEAYKQCGIKLILMEGQ